MCFLYQVSFVFINLQRLFSLIVFVIFFFFFALLEALRFSPNILDFCDVETAFSLLPPTNKQ
jgi:hypothetical protein